MGLIADILNLDLGLPVRNRLNAIIKFYNTVVKSDSSFNVERIDASYVKDATPTNTKFLRDDGTWQTVATNQNLDQTVTNGGIVNGSDNVTPIFQIDKVDDLVNVFSPSYFYENPVILFEAVGKVMTLDVGNRLISSGINFADIEVKTNKQNSLAADGTGTKLPTVDAINSAGFLKKQVLSITSSTTPTFSVAGFDETYYDITALAGNIASFGANITGTPPNRAKLMVSFTDNGTARTLGFLSTLFNFSTYLQAPVSTTIGKRLYLEGIYNSTTSKYDVINWQDGY